MPSLLNTVRDLERLRQIVGVLAKHGFGEVVRRTGLGTLLAGVGKRKKPEAEPVGLGVRVRLVLQELGPSFIKLGQIVSTRPDLVPAEIIVELKKLQDDVPPEAFKAIKDMVEAELNAPLAEIFESFDETPLACASIAQVHRATLLTADGVVEVVAKVQRPNVRDIMARDIDLLYWLAHAVERSIPESKLYSPVKLVAEFDRAVTNELDFHLEADNAERFAMNFVDRHYARFPKVYRETSSKRVLTLELFDGKKVYDAVEGGASGEVIAKRSIDIIIKQIFEDGFFHGDPHPGNVFILGDVDDPIIGMIDVGMVGQLTPQMRDRTIDLMVAAVREDYKGIADALYAIGRPTKKIDRRGFEAEVAQLAQKYLGKQLQDIEMSAMIRDFVYGARKYGIEVPADFLMLGKTLMTVEGVGKEIYPELNVFEEVKPFFLRLLQQRYSPERIGQDMMRSLVRLSGAANDMPLQLQEILEDARKGSFSIKIQETDLRDSADRLGRRAFSGLVSGAGIIGSSVLLSNEQYWLGGLLLTWAAGYGAGHWALVWLLGRREKRRRDLES